MTIACSSWAYRQVLPPKFKMILVMLADQAEDLAGKVCYGPTGLDHFAQKSCVPRRTLSRYLGALIRNGYLRRESNKDRGMPAHYWLCLDREPAKDIKEWDDAEEEWRTRNAAHPDEEESEEVADTSDPQDVEGVGQNGPGHSAPEMTETQGKMAQGVGHMDGPGVGHMDGPHDSTNYQRTKERARDEKKGSGFSKEAQNEAMACVVAERVNKSQNAQVFVIEHSEAWKYWSAEMTRRNGRIWSLSCEGTFNGRKCRGWYFPSLYPPANKSTAPPDGLSDADARALSGT